MEKFDSKIADISLADWGRKELDLAEIEMPGMTNEVFISYRTHELQKGKRSQAIQGS